MKERPVTLLGRTSQSLFERRWPEFAVEFVLIIVGILTALAIDGWVQDRSDRRAEATYLELLRDDLLRIEEELQNYVNFETANVSRSVALYSDLDSSNVDRDLAAIRSSLSSLSARRTLQIASAAFSDLQSTGNLRIISNHELRQDIVRYFSQAARTELVIEKNNTAFIDNLYLPFMLKAGITNGYTEANDPNIREAEEHLLRAFGNDVTWPRDEILLSPPDAPLWEDLRRQVIFRAKLSAVGVTLGRRAIDTAREIRTAIEEELGNPI